MTNVNTGIFICRQRTVARNLNRLRHTRDPGQPDAGGNNTFMHHAGAREAHVLLVQREQQIGGLLILQGPAHH